MSYRSRRSRSRSPGGRRSRSSSRDRRRRSRSRSRGRRSRERSPRGYDRRREPRGRPEMDATVQGTTTNIFVGNLPFRFDDRDLRDLFSPYGEVTRAVVGVNRETGQSKGFGFIAFAERKAAEDAMAGLAGRDIQGRVVRLDWDPGLDARGPGARAAGGVRGAPYEKRASPPPTRARSPSPRRRSPDQSN